VNSKSNKLTFWSKLRDPDYRNAFVSSTVAARLAVRIFNLRKRADWSQSQLAENTGMKQARISVLEQGDYENFTFSTLKKIAAAFNVGVIVDFVSFPDFVKWNDNFSSGSVVPDSFEDNVKGIGVPPSMPSFGQAQKEPHDNQDELSIPEITRQLFPSLHPGSRLWSARLAGMLN
jgi:transcriptional regulator with XRE-family HTH domain